MKHSVTIDLNGVMNKHFQHLIEDKHRYLCVYGGAGSSKSFSIGQKYFFESYSKPNMKLLVVRETARSNRESTFALFKDIISSFNKASHFKVNSSDMRITNTLTSNEIIFAGLDDVEKLKSIQGITDIWIEEASEISEADFNQLDIRLRGEGIYKQITLTFNPIDVNHWLKKRFVDTKSGDILVDHSTYKDNEHLDADYIKLLESYKQTDPYYYNVYCLGNWGVLGNTVFDANAINNRIPNLPKPVARGYFTYKYDGLRITNIQWQEDVNGYITIYEKPKKNQKYGAGGDTAGEGSDYFVGQMLSKDGIQVAVLRQQMDSDLWTKQMYCLGHYYNYALLTIEVNFDSYPIQELQRLGYNHMFIREVNDTALDKHKKAYGFRTDSWTRPSILNQLIEIVREHTELFNDRATLEEMLTFVRNDKGRMEAKNGSHDDLVMAVAIAYQGLSQIYVSKPKESKPRNCDIDPHEREDDGIEEFWG